MVCAYGRYSVLVSQVHCVISMYNCKLHPSSGVCCISSVRTLTSHVNASILHRRTTLQRHDQHCDTEQGDSWL